jgi:hypothetical protein
MAALKSVPTVGAVQFPHGNPTGFHRWEGVQYQRSLPVVYVLVHSRRRFLREVPSQFTEAHLP